MKVIFRTGVMLLKQDGIATFVRRTVKWAREYMKWCALGVQSYLFGHVDSCRGRIKLKKLRRETSIDGYVKFIRIMGGIEYCEENTQQYKILNENEKIEVVLPRCFEERENEKKTLVDSPLIYFTIFVEVDIYGDTNLISKKNIALSDMYYMDKGKNRYDIEGGCLVSSSRKGKWIRVAYKTTEEIVDTAIYCVGLACKNYFHFTFEILSRLAFIDTVEEYLPYPILVDAAALSIPQLKDLFDRINICQHPIIPVEQYSRVHVRRLLYVSRNLWMPPNFRLGTVVTERDYMFSNSVVGNIRKRILNECGETDKTLCKKIYLSRRNCQNQRLVNADEIEKIFSDYGFQIIFPEELSFKEEVEIFHNADIIVGATGAAFTNIVYCREGAKVGIIIPSSNDVYFFSNIANMVGVEFTVLGADIVTKGSYTSLDSFVLDADKCKRFVHAVAE